MLLNVLFEQGVSAILVATQIKGDKMARSVWEITKRQVAQLMVLGVVCAFLLGGSLPGVVMAQGGASANTDNSEVSAKEVTSALANTDGVLNASDGTKTSSDPDSAAKAVISGTKVDIPKDAEDGVSLDGVNTPAIDISIPSASQAKDAKVVAPGTVAYAGSDGFANAVQATKDGGVRMLTVIDSPEAPTEYEYKVTVPSGGHIEAMSDGGAVVVSENDEAIASIDAPWAKDSNGLSVETYFTTDGKVLTQHVLHNVPGVSYPITADPSFSIGWGRRCAASYRGRCIYSVSYPSSVTVKFSASEVRNAKRTGEWGGVGASLVCGYLSRNRCSAISSFTAYVISKVPDGRGVAIRFGEGGNALSWWTV